MRNFRIAVAILLVLFFAFGTREVLAQDHPDTDVRLYASPVFFGELGDVWFKTTFTIMNQGTAPWSFYGGVSFYDKSSLARQVYVEFLDGTKGFFHEVIKTRPPIPPAGMDVFTITGPCETEPVPNLALKCYGTTAMQQATVRFSSNARWTLGTNQSKYVPDLKVEALVQSFFKDGAVDSSLPVDVVNDEDDVLRAYNYTLQGVIVKVISTSTASTGISWGLLNDGRNTPQEAVFTLRDMKGKPLGQTKLTLSWGPDPFRYPELSLITDAKTIDELFPEWQGKLPAGQLEVKFRPTVQEDNGGGMLFSAIRFDIGSGIRYSKAPQFQMINFQNSPYPKVP